MSAVAWPLWNSSQAGVLCVLPLRPSPPSQLFSLRGRGTFPGNSRGSRGAERREIEEYTIKIHKMMEFLSHFGLCGILRLLFYIDKSSVENIASILINIYDQVTDFNMVFMKIFANLLSFPQFAYCFVALKWVKWKCLLLRSLRRLPRKCAESWDKPANTSSTLEQCWSCSRVKYISKLLVSLFGISIKEKLEIKNWWSK